MFTQSNFKTVLFQTIVFTNGPGDRCSIPGRVIPKTQKMVLDASLLNTQYKVWIKGKMEQSKKRISALPLHLGIVAIEKGAFRSPSTMVANFTHFFLPIDRTQSGATTPGQSRPGSDGNAGVPHIPRNSSVTGTSLSDGLVSYPEHSLEGVFPLCREAVGVFYGPS